MVYALYRAFFSLSDDPMIVEIHPPIAYNYIDIEGREDCLVSDESPVFVQNLRKSLKLDVAFYSV